MVSWGVIKPSWIRLYLFSGSFSVFEQLKKIYKIIKLDRNYKEGSKKYFELYQKYPNSVYADYALHKSIRYGGGRQFKRNLLIKNYPNSNYVKTVLKDIRRNFILKKEINNGRDYFQTLADTSRNSSLRLEAKKQLLEFDKTLRQRGESNNNNE